eukprot:CAMPEP_0113875210 /NCGR_PEP_ID=MMETSP0780_2-20120614/4805_1 /TAXON_ID=652834 /ORGANISM="Palpitomonas bilix" /LENGTH=202 /DNA_ID=CAMNT_0000861153 /DNA_START=52 /DNA_END=660 /DNA_ORIENTATION=+ /assembly_acc=CAM_ASM_000599
MGRSRSPSRRDRDRDRGERRHRDRDREYDEREGSPDGKRDRRSPFRERRRRSPSPRSRRDRSPGERRERERPPQVDDFGRVITDSRRRSESPGRERRGRRRRSDDEDGESKREMDRRRREAERLKEWGRDIENEVVETEEDRKEAILQNSGGDMDEMQMMKALGLPVDFESTKGKLVEGNVEGYANIKPNRKGRQYMNRVGK